MGLTHEWPLVESCAELVWNQEAMAPVLVPRNLLTPLAVRALFEVAASWLLLEVEACLVDQDDAAVVVLAGCEALLWHLLSLR